MGMAASQARFLGLTARKSNNEYQVQQINQQRTSLANESAGLYNEMLELEVPTPPSVNSFTETVYVLEDSNSDYSEEDYTISNMSKTYGTNGEYLVTLNTKKEQKLARNYNFEYRYRSTTESNDNITDVITISKKGSTQTSQLTCIRKKNEDGTLSIDDCFDENDKMESISAGQIYALPENENLCNLINGYSECKAAEGGENIKYFYQDKNGVNYFLTENDLFGTENAEGTKTGGLLNNDETTQDDNNLSFLSMYTYKKDTSIQVKAILEEASNGRLTSIMIADEEGYPEDLRNMTFALSATTVTDEEGYNQAYNDYEYEKGLYEKAVSDINAKTETIQAKDQSLELKIQQLDSEHNAIQTEMDSVTKVIEDNIEKTFNIFG